MTIDFTSRTIHELWIDGRAFGINITRPINTSIELSITRPSVLSVTDGAIVLLSSKPISQLNYPIDGIKYSASQNWLVPADSIGDAKVVGAFYNSFNNPFPISLDTNNIPTAEQTFSITITNTDPNTIYYASVHAASNILQYFSIGVQSYPLNIIQSGTLNTVYTGNIPAFPEAPTSPTPGMVYFDEQLNVVQYFDSITGSWIPSRSDTIISGSYNPGILGEVYLYGGTQLKVFNGKKWIDVTSNNLQLRIGSSWVSLLKFSAQIQEVEIPEIGELIYNFSTERAEYYNGTEWIYPNSSNTLFNFGSISTPIFVPGFVVPITKEAELLNPPYIGQLFYNTTSQSLNAWNGTSWNKVNTDQEGSTTQDKISIGDNGSYEARMKLIKLLNAQLGWPQLCVELQEEQFNIAIDNALQNYRQLSDGAYKHGFVLYKLLRGQQKYYLNSPIDKTDHIVSVNKIFRIGPIGTFGGGQQDVWSQAFAQQFYNLNTNISGTADILSMHLFDQYSAELQRILAGELMFQWDEPSHELHVLRAIRNNETVLIEVMFERSEQELFSDRWCQQYIQNWSLAELKMMLGLIRSKFSSGTPGPGGTINLNGELLISEARQDMTELKEQLMNYEFGGMVGNGNCSFVFG